MKPREIIQSVTQCAAHLAEINWWGTRYGSARGAGEVERGKIPPAFPDRLSATLETHNQRINILVADGH
jgi:hypothetical protein